MLRKKGRGEGGTPINRKKPPHVKRGLKTAPFYHGSTQKERLFPAKTAENQPGVDPPSYTVFSVTNILLCIGNLSIALSRASFATSTPSASTSMTIKGSPRFTRAAVPVGFP